MAPTLTPELARAAGRDAANDRMRKAGRTAWNAADYALACRVSARLMALIDQHMNGSRTNALHYPQYQH